MLGLVALFFGEFLFISPLASLLGYGHWVSQSGPRGKTEYTFVFTVDGIHIWLILVTFIGGLALYRAWESQVWRHNNPINSKASGLRRADSPQELAAALEQPNAPLLVEFESAEERKRKPPSLLGRLMLVPVLLFLGDQVASVLYLGALERMLLAVACLAVPAAAIRKALQAGNHPSTPDHRQLVDFGRGELYQLDCNSQAAPVLLARFSDFKSIEVKEYEPDVLICIIRYKVLLLGLETPVEFGPMAIDPRSANLVAERLSRLLNLPCQKVAEPDRRPNGPKQG